MSQRLRFSNRIKGEVFLWELIFLIASQIPWRSSKASLLEPRIEMVVLSTPEEYHPPIYQISWEWTVVVLPFCECWHWDFHNDVETRIFSRLLIQICSYCGNRHDLRHFRPIKSWESSKMTSLWYQGISEFPWN